MYCPPEPFSYLGKALKTYFESSPEAKRDVSEIDWSKCSFFLVDERCVPLDHVDSNYRLVIEHIIPNLPGARVEQVYPIDTTLLDNIDLCAHAYEKTLFEYFKSKLSNAADESSFWDAAGLDIALLGMGPDGHICSLFPSKPQSKWTANGIDGCPVSSVGAPYPLVVSIGDSPKPPLSRITMSLPLVCNSHDIIFLCGGAEKQDALDRIVKDPESGETLPAARALPIGYQNAKYTIECVVLNTAASDSNQITLHHSEHSRARNGEVRWFVDAAACKKIAL